MVLNQSNEPRLLSTILERVQGSGDSEWEEGVGGRAKEEGDGESEEEAWER